MESHTLRVLRIFQMKGHLAERRRDKRDDRADHFSARLCTCLHKAERPGSSPLGASPGLSAKTVDLLSKICTELAISPELQRMKI
jgi:hypothetical protein